MEKGHPAAVCAKDGGLIDQTVALCFQAAEVGIDIVDAKAEVMDSFAAFLDELRHRRFWTDRFQQFNVRLTGRKKGRANALRRYHFDVIDGKAERFVNLRRVQR